MTPLGVVFLFMLVNWWVEKRQRFLFNVYKRFILFLSRFLNVFNVFYFFWNVFYIYDRAIAHLSLYGVAHVGTEAGRTAVSFGPVLGHRSQPGTCRFAEVERHVLAEALPPGPLILLLPVLRLEVLAATVPTGQHQYDDDDQHEDQAAGRATSTST